MDVTGGGMEAVAGSVPPWSPELGWEGGYPTTCQGGRKRGNAKAWCGPSTSKQPYTPKPSITGTASGSDKELVCNRLGDCNCILTAIKLEEKRKTKKTNKKSPARLTRTHFQRPQSQLMHLICGKNCVKWGSMPVSFPPGPPMPQDLRTEWGQAQRMQTGWTRCLPV